MDRPLGSLAMFTKDDFEGDWCTAARGGFGQVFRVKHKRWRTTYAVKCPFCCRQDPRFDREKERKPKPEDAPELTIRISMNCLIEEAAKMEKIKFQHVVSIYGICDNPLGIVMEYMAGGSLDKILPTHEMAWQLKFRIIHETSLAINFLHSLSPPLAHLDLKPGNILLDANMHVKISDFGLSKWMEQSSRMQYIERSALLGTLSYIPPEMLLQTTNSPGTKCDVYSFGMVIWEILTQKKPYSGVKGCVHNSHTVPHMYHRPPLPGINTMGIIIKVAAGQRPFPESFCDEWPEECQQMVDLMKRCWDQVPKRRPDFTDISVETDMLLSLIQSPVVELQHEQLSRKMSLKPTFSGIKQVSKEGSGPGLSEGTNRSDTENDRDLSRCSAHSENESIETFQMSEEETSEAYENNLGLLHLMVSQGNLEKVKFLLQQGADVNRKIAGGYTSLILAVQNKSPEMTSLLIKHGADVNMPDEDSWSSLHFAAQNGDDRIVRLLLDHEADVDARELDGWTPLHLATQNNFENVVRLLLSRQADPNGQESEGRTALHLATHYGHIRIVKVLSTQGADLDKKQRNHRTPLHLAVERGKFRVVQYLLKSGTMVDCLDKNNYSALHLAAANGKYLICEKLIRYGANVHVRTDKGWTPLHLASFKGHVEIIRLLVDNQAKVNAKGSLDWTPLHLATRYSEEAAVAKLLRSGADPNVAENSSWTPLHMAVQRGNFLSIMDLLEHKAEVNAKNKGGWTPVHLAVLKGNETIVKTLLKAGALLELEDNMGCTPLQLAIRTKKQSIVDLLKGKQFSEVNWRSHEIWL